jgi:Asp-tRNA(Asn)/Glu-tRNA(Gln) amidotransferase A subunit family amidase
LKVSLFGRDYGRFNKKSAVELGQLIKNGETSSEEVVKTHLKRIKEVNP